MADERIANGHETGDAAGEGEAVELNEQEYAWLQEQLARLNREGPGGDTEDAEEWQDPTGGPLSELLAATEEGDAERVAQAAQGRTWDINTPGPDGDTALHLACLYGHEECVKALLDAGAAADCVNAQDGSTTLHDAAAGGYLSICELLLAKAGDGLVKVADEDGDTPLHNAARGNHVAVIRLLLAHGADPKAQNGEGNLPEDEADEAPAQELLRPQR